MVSCSQPVCKIEDVEEEKSFFKAHFWFFIVPAALILGISIYLEFFTEELILSQLLAFSSMIFSSYGVVKEAIEDVRKKKITANILMLIAAVASFFILHGQEGATAILLYSIAEHLEEITTEKSRGAIKNLLKLAPDESLLKTESEYKKVPSKTIKIGDIIGIKPGMKSPLDGVIVNGKAYIDESPITGESIPLFKKEGDEIFAASIITDNFVDIKVTRESSNTIVAQIAESIKNAQLNKSKHEKFIEKFAKYYTPIILFAALFVMFFPPLVLKLDFNTWFYRGLILLVVSCPCALTLSTPLANVSALTKLAKEGILVKGNRYIEKVKDIEAFAFDKTGTLTEGNLKVFDIHSFSLEKNEVLKIAASLENLSEHPIAKAITLKANQMKLGFYNVANFEVIKGRGIKGEINDKSFYVGNQHYFEDLNFDLQLNELKKIEISGTIPILLSYDKKIIGIITIRDVLRTSAPILIEGLKKRGYDSVLISGDNQLVCNAIGECLNIDNAYGELLPNQKLQEIEDLKKQYKGIAMVGDGINDAPALAKSDLGIAIGASATDITMETADVIIMGDDLRKLLTFIDISNKTNRKIRQNIWTSIIVKVSFAVLTVIGLMTLWIAVGIGDALLSFLILFNSLTIFKYKSKFKEISLENVESEAQMLVCDTCKTKNIIPQHHGRDMLKNKNGESLVCWKKLLNNKEIESCEEEISLSCPYCKNLLDFE